MNRESYIEMLEMQNGYCSCPDIADLLALRKKVSGLEDRCEFFERNFGDDVSAEDEPFLLDYKKSVEQFKQHASQYYSMITDYANQGKLKLVLHDSKRFAPLAEISAKQAIDLLSRTSKPIISVHCAKCSQQIDLTD